MTDYAVNTPRILKCLVITTEYILCTDVGTADHRNNVNHEDINYVIKENTYMNTIKANKNRTSSKANVIK